MNKSANFVSFGFKSPTSVLRRSVIQSGFCNIENLADFSYGLIKSLISRLT